MKKKFSILTAALLVFVMVFTACRPITPDPAPGVTTPTPGVTTPTPTPGTTPAPGATTGGEFVYGLRLVRAPIDTTRSTWIETGVMQRVAMEGLLYFCVLSFNLYPNLAVDQPVVTPDGLVWNWQVRSGIYFHDGSYLTTDDVLWTIERSLNPATGTNNATNFLRIVGAEEFRDGDADYISGIRIIDDYNLEVTLLEPFALFRHFFGTVVIHPREASMAAGDDWGTSVLIGTGPFMLDWHDPDIAARFVRNDNYHTPERGAQNIDSVLFRLFEDMNTLFLEYEAGNLDGANLPTTFVAQYREHPTFGSHVGTFPGFGHWYIFLNHEVYPWNNHLVRQAFTYTFCVTELARDLMDGVVAPAGGFVNPIMMGHNPDRQPRERNIERARELLAQAGYGPDHVFDVVINTSNIEGVAGRSIVAISALAREGGFNVIPEQLDSAVWGANLLAGIVPAHGQAFWEFSTDTDGIFFSNFHSSRSPGRSVNFFCDEFDRLVEEARTSMDHQRRLEIYRILDDMVVDQVAVIPLYWPIDFYVVQPWVTNYRMGNFQPNVRFLGLDRDAMPAHRR